MQFASPLRPTSRLAAALLLTCCATLTNAATIIGNLNGNDASATTLVGNLDRSKALGFTMPATGTYQLDSATLRLDIGNTAATIAAGLYASAAGTPTGSALVTFSIPAFVTTGIHNFTFLPTTTFQLLPSTTYFLVAYGTSVGSSSNYIDWMASAPSATPTGLATFAGAYADNSGAVTVPPTGSSSLYNSFAINATPAAALPLPSALTMSTLLILSAATFRYLRTTPQEAIA